MSDFSNKAVLLRQAHAAVTGPRQQSYGGPEEAFRIASAYSKVYMEQRRLVCIDRGISVDHDEVDQVILMVLVKLARLTTDRKHADSWRDLAGYAGVGAEVAKVDLTDHPIPSAEPENP